MSNPDVIVDAYCMTDGANVLAEREIGAGGWATSVRKGERQGNCMRLRAQSIVRGLRQRTLGVMGSGIMTVTFKRFDLSFEAHEVANLNSNMNIEKGGPAGHEFGNARERLATRSGIIAIKKHQNGTA